MRFIFSAPFRTKINLNSLKATVSPESVAATIDSAVTSAQDSLPYGFSWQTPWSAKDGGELHYAELSEDKLPMTATPLLQLEVSSDEVKTNLASPVRDAHINQCIVNYYDNTVAIMCIDIELTEVDNDSEILLIIDKWSTAFCSAIIKSIKPAEQAMLNKLTDFQHDRHGASFLHPENFTVFLDRVDLAVDDLQREEMLWVTRLFLSDQGSPDDELLEKWTQQPDLSKRTYKLGQAQAAFCVGNSVVFDRLTGEEELALKTALSLSSYFYTLYTILNKNLRTMFIDISKSKSVTSSIINSVNRTRSHIEFMENEFSDVLMGLQGLRNDAVRQWLQTWDYEELIEAVQRKKNAVGKLVDFSLMEKRSRYSRIIESILAGIGGVAILDFSLNLFSFSSQEPLSDDPIPGLVDAAQVLSVNGTLYTIIAFLLIVLILVVRKR